jgi:serine/threonine protein kinase
MRSGSLGLRLRPSEAPPSQLALLGLALPLAPLTWQQRLRIVAQATDALLYLHSRLIWHRDVKPDNIFLDERLTAYCEPSWRLNASSGW